MALLLALNTKEDIKKMSLYQNAWQSAPDTFFAYSLPKTLPYVDDSQRAHVENVFAIVAKRMDKMEEALQITGLTGETFAEYVKPLFDTRFERFEQMASDDLAAYALTVHDGEYVAPARVVWPNVDVVVDAAFTTTKEWETIRHIGIGGSDSAVILGKSHYKSKFQLFHDKRWTPEKLVDEKANKHKQVIFDRGHAMESNVIKAFCDLVGASVVPETRMFRSKTNPYSLADIDAVIQFPDKPNEFYIFEAKTTIAENFRPWSDGGIPVQYVSQTHQYPAVLNDPRIKGTYIGCLFTYDLSVYDNYIGSDYNANQFLSRFVERNPRTEQNLLAQETAFFEEHILTGLVPAFDGDPKKNLDSLRALVGVADSTVPPIEFDRTFQQLIESYDCWNAQKSRLNAEAKAIDEKLKGLSLPLIETLGTAIEGRLPILDSDLGAYWEIKYSPRPKTSVDLEKLEHKYPDAFSDCVEFTPNSYRVFSVRVKKEKQTKKKKK